MRRFLWATALGATAAIGCGDAAEFDLQHAPLTPPQTSSPAEEDAGEPYPGPDPSPPLEEDAGEPNGEICAPIEVDAGVLPDAGYVFVDAQVSQRSLYDTDNGLDPFTAACVLEWASNNACGGDPTIIYRDTCDSRHGMVLEKYVYHTDDREMAIGKMCVQKQPHQYGQKRIDCAAACAEQGRGNGRCVTLHSRHCPFVRPQTGKTEYTYVRYKLGQCVCSGVGFDEFRDNGFDPANPGCLKIDANPQCTSAEPAQVVGEFCFSDHASQSTYGVIMVNGKEQPRGLLEMATADWDSANRRFIPHPNGDGQCREYPHETKVDCDDFCDRGDDNSRNRSRKGYCRTVGTAQAPACVSGTKKSVTSAYCHCF